MITAKELALLKKGVILVKLREVVVSVIGETSLCTEGGQNLCGGVDVFEKVPAGTIRLLELRMSRRTPYGSNIGKDRLR
jgi:hypothetical protein